jgi:dipeptidyl aminopeptidase/acylaminoacyl peptidase
LTKKGISLAAVLAVNSLAAVHTHPGGQELAHEAYVRAVSEEDSPVEQHYVKSKDGVYVAVALRKPKGAGPFPVLLYFHGAPGGRGMQKLTQWSLGETGGPLWEGFLKQGFIVAVADYRHPVGAKNFEEELPAGRASYVDDAEAVFEFVKKRGDVDASRISAYGVSLGGNVVAHLATRVDLWRVVLGAPAPGEFLDMETRTAETVGPRALERARKVRPPVMILVGTKDGLLPLDRKLHDTLTAAGKSVELHIFENGYHDFVAGPQGHEGRQEPLLDATLAAFELALKFVRGD